MKFQLRKNGNYVNEFYFISIYESNILFFDEPIVILEDIFTFIFSFYESNERPLPRLFFRI